MLYNLVVFMSHAEERMILFHISLLNLYEYLFFKKNLATVQAGNKRRNANMPVKCRLQPNTYLYKNKSHSAYVWINLPKSVMLNIG